MSIHTVVWGLAGLLMWLIALAGLTRWAMQKIHEYERMHAQLQWSHEQRDQHQIELKMLVEGVSEVLFRTDLQGVIRIANQRWTALTGWPVDAIEGRRLVDMVVSEDRSTLQTLLRDQAHNPHAHIVMRTHLVNRHGDPVAVELSLSRQDFGQSHNAGYGGFALDLTDRQKVELDMEKARDDALASEAMKAAFIANVSHELRTPLQSVIGFSELAIKRDMPVERMKTVLTDIHLAGKRMLRLVNEILDVSRHEASMNQMALENADLRQIILDVMHEIEPIAQQKQVQLSTLVGDAPATAMVHAFKLGQVVRNVVANAIRFSAPEQTVVVQLMKGKDGWLITCRDHGPGVPEDELESIFEPFTQSSRNDANAGGTGLGLTISRSIMKAHHGRIWAQNATDGGSVFNIWLPHAATPTA